MTYRIKEKFWSWGNDFSIQDAEGNLCYYVDGQAFSWGNKLSFQDTDRNELAFISQKLLSWKPRYQVIIDGAVFAEVIKEWSYGGGSNSRWTSLVRTTTRSTDRFGSTSSRSSERAEGWPRSARNTGHGPTATALTFLMEKTKSPCYVPAS